MQFYQKVGYAIQSKQIVYDPTSETTTKNKEEENNNNKNAITIYLMTRENQ